MTGEKIRSLRRDHKPCKDEELLEPDEEATAGGTFTRKNRNSKSLSNHRVSRAPSNPAITGGDGEAKAGTYYPVHECVFKGDIRRLSSLIRTHSISQKDNHGQ